MLGDRLADFVVTHRGRVLAAVLAITALAAFGGRNLRFDTSIDSWFLDDDPMVISYDAFKERFGADEFVLVAVTADDVFTPEVLQGVERIAEGARKAPHVVAVRSLLDAPLVRREDGTVVVGTLSEGAPRTVEEAQVLKERALDSSLIRGRMVTEDGRTTLVIAELDPEHTDLEEKIAMVEGVRAAAAAEGLDFHLAGLPVLDSAIGDLARQDSLRIGPMSGLVIIIVGFLVFGRLRTSIVPLIVVWLALSWVLGFIGAVGWGFGILGGPLMNVILAVGVADSVHVIADSLRRTADGQEPLKALRGSLSDLLVPCFFTSITSVAGFLALWTSDIGPVREFGVLSALGAASAFVLTFTFLPWFVGWVKPPGPKFLARQETGPLARLLKALARPKHPRVVLVAFVLITVASLYGMTQVHVGANPIRYFRDGSPAQVDTLAVEEAVGGSATMELLLEAPNGGLRDPAVLARVAELEGWLREAEGITSVTSLLDVYRETHRAMIGDAKLPESRAMAAQLLLLVDGQEGFEEIAQDDASIGRMTVRFEIRQLERIIEFAPSLEARLEAMSDETLAVSATGYGLLFARLDGYLVDSQVRGLLIAFLVITLMMALLLRSLKLALLAMIPNLAPIVVGLAVMAVFDIPLDPGTLMVGPLALGLVVDDTVHFLVRYRRRRALGESPADAAADAVEHTGRAIVLTTVLLSASFMTLLTASTAMAMHFGMIAAIVAVLALVADLVVLPAVLSLRP
jgi:uncharacterized protein